MIAICILVLSILALAEFAISQWRSMWILVGAQPLSSSLQSATGISAESLTADHFSLLAQTTEQLCPSREEGNLWLREVGVYYRIVRLLDKNIPSLSGWAKDELLACSRYAAVVLDQRLNANLAYASKYAVSKRR
jgi:hypothetical protein